MSLAMHDGPAGIVVPGIGPARIGIKLQNDQITTGLHDTTISIKCPAGGALTIYWGDGTASAVTCNNVLNAYTHTYTVQARYTILVVGTTTLIATFNCYSQAWLGGNIANVLSGLDSVNLKVITLASTPYTGDVSAFSRLTGLTSVNIAATSLTGNLASFAPLTSLTSLLAFSTALTGDMGSLATITGFTSLYLYAVPALTYTSRALPPWNGAALWLFSSGLSSAEVDAFLIDFADGCGTTGTRVLKLAGTNAARTSASDAAKAALVAAGWTVEVNE